MAITRRTFIASIGATSVAAATLAIAADAAESTPQPKAIGCSVPSGTPEMSGHAGHGTPMAGTHDVEFDQMYIDMMMPHHQSIIALSEVALPLLEDQRLKDMAQDIIESQTAEQETMQKLRKEWYGSAESEPLDEEMMMITMGHSSCDEHGMDMDEMMNIMDAEWNVETFLAAEDYDMAFIKQTIPHHQMAIDSSELALELAVHPELKEIAEDVIEAQQREMDTLETIMTEISGESTPAA